VNADEHANGLFFAHPVPDLKVFFYLTAFVPVLIGFVRTAFDVPEVMFGISDQFGQNLRSFAHNFSILLSETRFKPKRCQFFLASHMRGVSVHAFSL
jgi:hypothetical protein